MLGGRLIWNEAEERLRAPVRVTLWVVLYVVTVSIGSVIGKQFRVLPSVGNWVLSSLLLVVLYAGLIVVACRYIDRRTLADFGYRLDGGWQREFAFGFVMGGAMLTFAFLFHLAFGWVHITGFFVNNSVLPFPVTFALIVFSMILVSFVGLAISIAILKNISEGLSGYTSSRNAILGAMAVDICMTAILSLSVAGGSPFQNLVNIVITLTLIIAYLYTGRVFLPAGIDAAWVLCTMIVYGGSSSSLSFDLSLIGTEYSGPAAITGGSYGVDGGLIGLFTAVIGVFILFGWIRYTGRLSIPKRIYKRTEKR